MQKYVKEKGPDLVVYFTHDYTVYLKVRMQLKN